MWCIPTQSIIYYTVRSPRLEQWIDNPSVRQALDTTAEDSYVDLDPTFSSHVDEDYDHRLSGISRQSFCNMYLPWIQYCASRQDRVSCSCHKLGGELRYSALFVLFSLFLFTLIKQNHYGGLGIKKYLSVCFHPHPAHFLFFILLTTWK